MKTAILRCRFVATLIFLMATDIGWAQRSGEVKQVLIETRFVEVSDDQLGEIGFDWITPRGAGLFGFSPRISRRGVESGAPGTATSTNGTSLSSGVGMIDPTNLIPQPQPGFPRSGRFGPVVLDDNEFQSAIRSLRDEGVFIAIAPTVTVFSGQTATITDQEQRPFVLGIDPVVEGGGGEFEPTLFSSGETIFEFGGGAALDLLTTGNPTSINQNQNQQFQFQNLQQLQNQTQRLQQLNNQIQNQNQQTVNQVRINDSMNENAADLTMGWTYFLNNNVGLGTQFEWLSGNGDDGFMGQAEATYRVPIEFGDFAIAPYLKGGVGGISIGDTDEFVGSIGGGIEFRNQANFGVFGEYSQNFLSNGEDFGQILVGVRIVPNAKGGQRRGRSPRGTGVTLDVTPTVSDDGTIDLEFAPEVVEFEGFVNYGSPLESTPVSSITTGNNRHPGEVSPGGPISNPPRFGDGFGRVFPPKKRVVVADGQTAVVGGVITDPGWDGNWTQSEQDNFGSGLKKKKFLGGLPGMGQFVPERPLQRYKHNLQIFVTARLINPSGEEID